MVRVQPEQLVLAGGMPLLLLLRQALPLEAAFVQMPSSTSHHVLLDPETYRDHFIEGWPGPYNNVRLRRTALSVCRVTGAVGVAATTGHERRVGEHYSFQVGHLASMGRPQAVHGIHHLIPSID